MAAHVERIMGAGKLENLSGSKAEKICMIAVAYHNLAVNQCNLEMYQQACVTSQNARRLARLSLSYSNRWLKQFDATHQEALLALSDSKKAASTTFKRADQTKYLRRLGSVRQ